MRKILKSKKGMTLVELMAGMLVFVFITLAASVVVTPTLRAYMLANDLAESNALLDTLANQLTENLSRATERVSGAPLVLTGNPADTDEITFKMWPFVMTYFVATDGEQRGALHQTMRIIGSEAPPGPHEIVDLPVLDKVFYNRKSVEVELVEIITCDPPCGDADHPGCPIAYEITLTITRDHEDNSPMVSRTYAVRPIVLNQ